MANPDKRNKTGWLRVHISPEHEATIRRAAKVKDRSVTNWVERYVVGLAEEQIREEQE